MPFTLPEHVAVCDETLVAIANRHALDSSRIEHLSETGIFNQIHRVGGDATIEARIVWRHLQLAIWTLPRGAVPGRSWAERPLPMLLEVLRFFADPMDDRWHRLKPVVPDRASGRGLATAAGGGRHA